MSTSPHILDPARLAALRSSGLLEDDIREPLDRLARVASRAIGAPVALASAVDVDRQVFAGQSGLHGELERCRESPLSHSFCQYVVADRAPLVIGDARNDERVSSHPATIENGVRAYAGVPLDDGQGNALGSLCVVDVTPRQWTQADLDLLGDLAHSCTTEIALRRALREERDRSRTDALTGLGNRLCGVEELERRGTGGSGEGASGLLIIDIDRFKAVNDDLGHEAGDAVLAEVARRMRAAIGSDDLLVRWGGEEFLAIPAGAPDDADLRALGEGMRAAVAADPVSTGAGEVRVTISAGGAHAANRAGTTRAVLVAADQALYAAKREGRDRVLLAADLQGPMVKTVGTTEAQRVAMAISRAVALRDGVTEEHCREVADLSARTAERLGLPEATVEVCHLAGWLHDLGKVAVPDAILAKPGALTEEEWAVMATHPVVGEALVLQIPGLSRAAAGIRHHHERVDGGGYPDGLVGDAIPIEARIVAAADAYSAITSSRVYRPERDERTARHELERAAGSHFDARVARALLEVLAERPHRGERRSRAVPGQAPLGRL